MSRRKQLVGVDVGGTFTDFFFLNPDTGVSQVEKLPTSVENQSVALVAGIKNCAPLDTVATIIHGTTAGTNAILQRAGARVGVITTRGFRDILEMRRRDRPHTWGLTGEFDPLSTRDLRVEVDERTLADGTIRTALDEAAVAAAATALKDAGAESIAIVFINAYANPTHERRAREVVSQLWPNTWINCSSDILPEIREFERASTTAMNAYLQPVVGRYLGALSERLEDGGFGGSVFIVQSNGGVMTLDTAAALPVRTALSGPAAGVTAAAAIAQRVGVNNLITCDLGGTSFDVSLIANGQSVQSAQMTIDFGLIIRTPMVEITTIGAGGGSIARVDAGGILKVGPQSAGSNPGPVCYGLGSTEPTLTDAHVVLGRINVARPIGGGRRALDLEAARDAIARSVGQPLGLETEQAADAIVRVANSRMAGAIRLVSIERGFDPAEFAIMPFGGGGGLHVGALMKEVGLREALVPRYPGITSAMGCLIADLRHDRVQTINVMLDAADLNALMATMAQISRELRRLVTEAEVAIERIESLFEFDMSYVGQTHAVTVPVAVDDATSISLSHAGIEAVFDALYRQRYGRTLIGQKIRIDALRVACIGRRPPLDLATLASPAGSLGAAQRGERPLYLQDAWRSCPVYDRLRIPTGSEIEGPAVLEQDDTTIVIEDDHRAWVDDLGNLRLVSKADPIESI